MEVVITEVEKDKLISYETGDGASGRVTCTAEGAGPAINGLLAKLGATTWEIHYAGGAKAQGRRNPDSKL